MLKPSIHRLRTQSGMAFIWILLLLVTVSALSLSFLQKAVIGTSAAVSRESAVKAGYLARSAANHALWRLLNDPDFSPTGTDYDMHDFGDGRYGYKVRKPTLTKFGTVAAVGAVGDAVAKQSYVQYLKPYNIIAAYDRTSGAIPKFRRLFGASWLTAADTVNDGTEQAHWMVLKGCPRRKEVIMGTLDNSSDINLAIWDGSAWGNLFEFTNNTGSNSYRSFDIAYETLSGDALVVGYDKDDAEIQYNVWNGTTWAFGSPHEVRGLDESDLSFVTMASNPHTDEILIAAVTTDKDIRIIQWNGTAFNDLGVVDNNMETSEYACASIVYEQQSGTGMILWNHNNSKSIYYRLWNGTVLTGTGQLPQFGQKPLVIRAAPDPSGDTILAAAVDNNDDLSLALWDGTAWIDSREIFASVAEKEGQVIDVAWEDSGGAALVVFAGSADKSSLRFYRWQKGTALSDHAVQTGPDFQNDIYKILLQPVSGSQKIILQANTNGSRLGYCLWTGSRFLGDPAIQLESSLSGYELPFGIAESVAP